MTPIEKKLKNQQKKNSSSKNESTKNEKVSKREKKQPREMREIVLASDDLLGEREKHVLEQENDEDFPSANDIIKWVKNTSNPSTRSFSSWVMSEYGTDLDGNEMANFLIKALKKCTG